MKGCMKEICYCNMCCSSGRNWNDVRRHQSNSLCSWSCDVLTAGWSFRDGVHTVAQIISFTCDRKTLSCLHLESTLPMYFSTLSCYSGLVEILCSKNGFLKSKFVTQTKCFGSELLVFVQMLRSCKGCERQMGVCAHTRTWWAIAA